MTFSAACYATEGYFAGVDLPLGTYSVTYTPPAGLKLPIGAPKVLSNVVVYEKTVTELTFDVSH